MEYSKQVVSDGEYDDGGRHWEVRLWVRVADREERNTGRMFSIKVINKL